MECACDNVICKVWKQLSAQRRELFQVNNYFSQRTKKSETKLQLSSIKKKTSTSNGICQKKLNDRKK